MLTVKYRGLRPWQRFLQAARANQAAADAMARRRLVRRTLIRLGDAVQERRRAQALVDLDRNVRALGFWRARTARRAVLAWRSLATSQAGDRDTADAHADAQAQRRAWKVWVGAWRERQAAALRREATLTEVASLHHDQAVGRRAVTALREFLLIAREEREAAARRSALRAKVDAWLDDLSSSETSGVG